MTLSIPSYIQAAGVVHQPIEHEWKDADEQAVLTGNATLEPKIRTISHKGIAAISLGAIEWLIWRLEQHLPDRVPFQIVEASWAGIIDWRYLKWQDLPIEEWEELPWPVGEPLINAFRLFKEMLFMLRDGGFIPVISSCLAELPLHVLNDPEPYKQWRRFVVRRLAKKHPANREDRMGTAVPRQALDPNCDYESANSAELVSVFLQGLDHSQNPYLSSPEEIIEQGFSGTPYA